MVVTVCSEKHRHNINWYMIRKFSANMSLTDNIFCKVKRLEKTYQKCVTECILNIMVTLYASNVVTEIDFFHSI